MLFEWFLFLVDFDSSGLLSRFYFNVSRFSSERWRTHFSLSLSFRADVPSTACSVYFRLTGQALDGTYALRLGERVLLAVFRCLFLSRVHSGSDTPSVTVHPSLSLSLSLSLFLPSALKALWFLCSRDSMKEASKNIIASLSLCS